MTRKNSSCYLKSLFWVAIYSLLVLNSTSAFGQRPPTPSINLNYLRIDFIQTSARRAGLGGAFIGAATDESAGLVNPAGLTFVRTPGASLHFRLFKLDGRFDSDQFVVAAFFPIKRFGLAFVREHWLNSRFDFETEQLLTIDPPYTNRQVLGGLGNFPGRKVFMDLQLILERLSLAYAISDRLSLGATLSNVTLEFNHTERTFLDPQIADGSAPRGNLAETNYSNTTLNRRNGLVLGYTVGLMTTLLVDKLFLGAIYNLNPSFRLKSDVFLPEYEINSQILTSESPENTNVKFSLPDSYGIGFYYRANDRLNLTLDLIRREYADLLSENELNIPADDELDDQTQTFLDPDGKPDLIVENATEFHFGLELIQKLKGVIVPLRFGFYTDPGHHIHAISKDSNLQKLYPNEKDRIHFTFGLGIIGSSFYKYDLSADLSADGWQLFFSGTFTAPEY